MNGSERVRIWKLPQEIHSEGRLETYLTERRNQKKQKRGVAAYSDLHLPNEMLCRYIMRSNSQIPANWLYIVNVRNDNGPNCRERKLKPDMSDSIPLPVSLYVKKSCKWRYKIWRDMFLQKHQKENNINKENIYLSEQYTIDYLHHSNEEESKS